MFLELEKHYLKKLKILFRFNCILALIFAISIIRLVRYCLNYRLYENDGFNTGTVANLSKKKSYTVLDIKSNIKYKAYLYYENDIAIGDVISFDYINKTISKNTIFNAFNYKKYLKSKNIRQVVEIKNYKKIKVNKYYQFKGFLYKHIQAKKSSRYIMTFLCGDKSYLDSDIKQSYTNNGIAHLLCVSGVHVLLIFNFLKNILTKICKKSSIVIILMALFAAFYLIISSFMIALFRAVCMYFFSYFNEKCNFFLKSMYSFLFTLFLSVLIWPHIIFDIGFYYTFIITFFLLCFTKKLTNIFKVSFFCFFVALPISVYTNFNINLLSIIYSIVSSFFVCYIMYPLCFLSMLFGVADKVLYKFSYIFEIINLKLDGISLFKIIVPRMSIFLIILIYILFYLYITKKRKIYFNLILTIFLYVFFSKYIDSNIYVYYMDVGQGDMMVIISKHFRNVTILDIGGNPNNNYLKNNIKVFLHSIGVSTIDSLILSHGDFDHMGEAVNLVNNFKVENVIFNCGPYNDLEKELIKVLDKKKIKYYSCIKELNIDKNKLHFLHTKEYDTENDNSNVVYTELNGYKFMFMGDASATAEKEILDKYNLPDIDVLKVGHHGSKTSSGKKFIDEINPKYSIISVGKNNRYGHPNKEVLDNLKNSKIYRTDQDGSIMFKFKNNKLKIKTCSS